MSDHLTVTSLAVGHGDATLVEWVSDSGAPIRILVDGGPKGAAKHVADEVERLGPIDLLVLSHVDADHLDGLTAVVDRVEVREWWGPCLPAFERHRWLFPARIVRGLDAARAIEETLAAKRIPRRWPMEGHAWRPSPLFAVQVLSPPARVMERLLLGDDAFELFTRAPMPLGWLSEPEPEPPEERDVPSRLRDSLRTSTWLGPADVLDLPSSRPVDGLDALREEWGATFGMDPEFFGNPVLNDTSLVLGIEVVLGGRRRTVLLPGDQENWAYLAMRHGRGLAADVLKAPHHGGRLFIEDHKTEAWDEILQWMRPEVVLMSASGRHGLPRTGFREAALRWGATVACPNERGREVITGPTPGACCFGELRCTSRPQRDTRVLITRDGLELDRPSCATGGGASRIGVIRLSQHIVDPSPVLDRLTQGELDRHLQWLGKQLRALHLERRGEGHSAVAADVLVAAAHADGRHRLALDLHRVASEGRRRGVLWYREGGYPDGSRLYAAPTRAEVEAVVRELSGLALICLTLPQDRMVDGLSRGEVIELADASVLVEWGARRSGFPAETFRELYWPTVAQALGAGHGFRVPRRDGWGWSGSQLWLAKSRSFEALIDDVEARVGPARLEDLRRAALASSNDRSTSGPWSDSWLPWMDGLEDVALLRCRVVDDRGRHPTSAFVNAVFAAHYEGYRPPHPADAFRDLAVWREELDPGEPQVMKLW